MIPELALQAEIEAFVRRTYATRPLGIFLFLFLAFSLFVLTLTTTCFLLVAKKSAAPLAPALPSLSGNRLGGSPQPPLTATPYPPKFRPIFAKRKSSLPTATAGEEEERKRRKVEVIVLDDDDDIEDDDTDKGDEEEIDSEEEEEGFAIEEEVEDEEVEEEEEGRMERAAPTYKVIKGPDNSELILLDDEEEGDDEERREREKEREREREKVEEEKGCAFCKRKEAVPLALPCNHSGCRECVLKLSVEDYRCARCGQQFERNQLQRKYYG